MLPFVRGVDLSGNDFKVSWAAAALPPRLPAPAPAAGRFLPRPPPGLGRRTWAGRGRAAPGARIPAAEDPLGLLPGPRRRAPQAPTRRRQPTAPGLCPATARFRCDLGRVTSPPGLRGFSPPPGRPAEPAGERRELRAAGG